METRIKKGIRSISKAYFLNLNADKCILYAKFKVSAERQLHEKCDRLYKFLWSFQIHKTEQNFMLMNLIISELAISVFGIPLDFLGSITHGTVLNSLLCPLGGFTHTFFGKCNIIYLNRFFANLHFTLNVKFIIIKIDIRLDRKIIN